jgi:hypothetical protein
MPLMLRKSEKYAISGKNDRSQDFRLTFGSYLSFIARMQQASSILELIFPESIPALST